MVVESSIGFERESDRDARHPAGGLHRRRSSGRDHSAARKASAPSSSAADWRLRGRWVVARSTPARMTTTTSSSGSAQMATTSSSAVPATMTRPEEHCCSTEHPGEGPQGLRQAPLTLSLTAPPTAVTRSLWSQDPPRPDRDQYHRQNHPPERIRPSASGFLSRSGRLRASVVHCGPERCC